MFLSGNYIFKNWYCVLLIHANSDTMRQWLWRDILNNKKMFYKPFGIFVIHAIGSVVCVYIICTIIDRLRICLIEKPLLVWLERRSWQK